MQLCQNFGISGRGVWTPQTPPRRYATGSCVATLYSLQILLLRECRWHTLNCYLFQGREEDQTLQNKTRRSTVRDWISSVWEPGGISQLLQASPSLSQSEALLSCEWWFCQRDGSGELRSFVAAVFTCTVFSAVCTQFKFGQMDWFRFSCFRAISGGAPCTRIKASIFIVCHLPCMFLLMPWQNTRAI